MVKNRLILSVALIVFAPLLLHGADYSFAGEDHNTGQTSSLDGSVSRRMARTRVPSYRPRNWVPSQNGEPIEHSHLVDLVIDDSQGDFTPGARNLLKNSPHGPEILDAYRSARENLESDHLKSLMTGERVGRSIEVPSPKLVKSIFSEEFTHRILGSTPSQRSSVTTTDHGLSLTPSQRSSVTDSLFNTRRSSSADSLLSDLGTGYFVKSGHDDRPVGSFLDKRIANAPLVPPSSFSDDDLTL